MIATDFLRELRDCHEPSLVGGKALNLAKLIHAGFPVPDGFVVTTEAYRYAHRTGAAGKMPADLAAAIRDEYRRIGSPSVAVRSSATAEDMAEASMAGQYDTFLDIVGEEALIQAVQRCWASLDSPRTRTYLREHGIDLAQVAMAVVVQRLVPADVAGVLFTANARTGARHEMLVEASWGLGEAVVSGLVQPDVLRLDAANGQVIEAIVNDKEIWIPPGEHEEQPVPDARRCQPCLGASDVAKLWQLGCLAERHFGRPQDIEWAIYDGELFILQSRAITTLEEAEAYEHCLQDTRAELRKALAYGRGAWVLHNIAETLPHPTPLTWGVVRRFMSGSGGYGNMYREVGFAPSPVVCEEGFLTLIAGKPYMDLSLAPDMFFEGFPFKYDVEELRGNPDAGQAPPMVPTGSPFARMGIAGKLGAVNGNLRARAVDFDRQLTDRIIPEFVGWCRAEKARDLTALSIPELLGCWEERERRVLDEFAPDSLLPSLIVGMALADLRGFLDERFWDDDPDDLVNEIAVSPTPDTTMASNAELYAVGTGKQSAQDWIAAHGHRAPAEFDLATPRWRERPQEVRAMAASLAAGRSPAEVHRARVAQAEARVAELKGQLTPSDAEMLDNLLGLVRRYLRFREDGKDALMQGYDLLRDVALEAGARLGIGDDVFLLTPEEFGDALLSGYPPLHCIAERRLRRQAETRVELPSLVDEAALDTLGTPVIADGQAQAVFPVSTGAATGPVRIVLSPEGAGDLGQGYILVCPSTDPAWTPLFVNAAGLILERGGTLSHGAVVAREMGIPAVVMPGATTTLEEGEVITVDGRHGAVVRNGEADTGETAASQATNTRVARALVPPGPGAGERRSGIVQTVFLAIWGLYLAGVFLLPTEVLRDPTYRLLDGVLWPLVPSLGKPATVAIIAAVFAALTMVGQRLLTDHHRLVEAKRRANLLRKEAMALPADAPRRAALLRLAAPVQNRISMAAFVPLAVLLGPLVMTFCWLPERLDPAAWNARPGTPISIVATLDSKCRQPIELTVPSGFYLEDRSPKAQTLPPIAETLEDLYANWSMPSDLSGLPWEAQAAAMKVREEMLADLKAYIDAGVPPQSISWRVRPSGKADGRFAFAVAVPDSPAVKVRAVFGDKYPPSPAEVQGADKSPIKSVKVVYANAPGHRLFWAPLAHFGRPDWDAGWLLVYLLGYLPPMILLRWLLRIP